MSNDALRDDADHANLGAVEGQRVEVRVGAEVDAGAVDGDGGSASSREVPPPRASHMRLKSSVKSGGAEDARAKDARAKDAHASGHSSESRSQPMANGKGEPANDLGLPRIDWIPTDFETAFTEDYGGRADLRALYEKAKDGQWNARTHLDWTQNVDPEAENIPDQFIPIFGTPVWDKLDRKRDLPRLRRHASSYLLSNFLHGEQGALLATSQIVCAVPDHEAKLYAASQVMDEARHVEAYERYLREKVELTYPISPHLRTLLEQILRESRWDVKFLGMQIMVEGLALAAFGLISQTSNEPLIREIVRMIMIDESRHVAFGVLSLRGLYDDMTASERADREEFIIESSRLMRDRFLMQEVWENLDLPVEECLDAVRHSPIMQTFQTLLFSKIVPNVKRLGLLTPNVRKAFEDLRVIQYETWDATA